MNREMNLKVLSVSSKLSDDGEIAATINVLEFPPSDSRSNHVNTDSRYGM